jgi:Fic family protein
MSILMSIIDIDETYLSNKTISKNTMNVNEFHAGRYEKQQQYQSFLPASINKEWVVSHPQTLTLIEEATHLLGALNAFSQLIPDVDFFIHMHITKEATTSSRIEGTQTSMEEALLDEGEINPEKRNDWQEVQNYIKAINFAIEKLPAFPLSNRLLQNTHAVLLQGVRGKHKQPGEFRISQNWIGVNLKHAAFISPHHDHVPELMNDLEKFMHNDHIHVPHVIKAALIHYQLETIHPFLDGNGRLGRLLIMLYLVNFGILHKPALYLSDFFERHKGEYYDQLMAVRRTNKLEPWLQFFIIGLAETAQHSIQVFKDILKLKEKIESQMLVTFHTKRRSNAQRLIRHLYGSPVVTIKVVRQLLQSQTNTAAALIRDLMKLEILREFTGLKRNRLFIFEPYVQLFRRNVEEE